MSNKEVAQWEQLHDTLNGLQNFCIIEQRKAPQLYELLCAHVTEVLGGPNDSDIYTRYRHGREGNEVVVSKPGFFELYTDLLDNRDQYHRYEFQVAMGTLLGYSIESCIEFASDPVECDCQKCGGRENPRDAALRGLWIEAGCPHPLNPTALEYSQVWSDESEKEYRSVTNDGKAYGKLMETDWAAVRGNPALQDWSIPK
jgi:hypothetical protein